MCCSYFLENSTKLAGIAHAASKHRIKGRMLEKLGQPLITEGEVLPGRIAPVIAPDRRGESRVFPMVWGFTGSLPIAVAGVGYSDKSDRNGRLFISPDSLHARNIKVGDPVHITFPDTRQIEAKVTDISWHPMSNDEIGKAFGYNSWIVDRVTMNNDYNYVLSIEAEEELEKDMLFNAQVVEDTVVPIVYFMG